MCWGWTLPAVTPSQPVIFCFAQGRSLVGTRPTSEDGAVDRHRTRWGMVELGTTVEKPATVKRTKPGETQRQKYQNVFCLFRISRANNTQRIGQREEDNIDGVVASFSRRKRAESVT